MSNPNIIRTFVPELDAIVASKFTFKGKEYNPANVKTGAPADPFPHKILGDNGAPVDKTALNGLWLAGLIVFVQPASGHVAVNGVCPTCGRPPGEIATLAPTVDLSQDEPDEGEVAAMIAAQRAKMGTAKPVALKDEGVVIDDPTHDEPEANMMEQSSAVAAVMSGNAKLGASNPPPRAPRKNSPAAPAAK